MSQPSLSLSLTHSLTLDEREEERDLTRPDQASLSKNATYGTLVLQDIRDPLLPPLWLLILHLFPPQKQHFIFVSSVSGSLGSCLCTIPGAVVFSTTSTRSILSQLSLLLPSSSLHAAKRERKRERPFSPRPNIHTHTHQQHNNNFTYKQNTFFSCPLPAPSCTHSHHTYALSPLSRPKTHTSAFE